MAYLEAVDAKALKELLNKGWMTHDAMWFLHCLQATDIETANRVNLAAIKDMAGVEIKRLIRFIGLPSDQGLTNFEQLKTFFKKAEALVIPAFMKFNYQFIEPDRLHVVWQPGECFAYKGIQSLGFIDRYICGIFPRIESWFDGLGLTYTVTPVVTGCMMHTHGECFRDYRLAFIRP